MNENLKSIFANYGGIMKTSELKEVDFIIKKFKSFLKMVKLSRYAEDIISI